MFHLLALHELQLAVSGLSGTPRILTALDGRPITIITIVGAFVFGISGGLAAVRSRLDIFGVMVLAATVGLAGGILRDVLLGQRATSLFDWRVISAVVAAGLVAFIGRDVLSKWRDSMEIFDAVGLSLFCVIGASLALEVHAGPVPAAILGTVTGVGGGVVRDVVLNRVPAVLREGLYAIPALVGASIVVIGHELRQDHLWWYGMAALTCLVIRLIGIHYQINLPVAALGRRATDPLTTDPSPAAPPTGETGAAGTGSSGTGPLES
jgi:uncharacterized membrane protein YeiH